MAYEPGPHGAQQAEVQAKPVEYAPRSHSRQLDAPVLPEYVPAGQPWELAGAVAAQAVEYVPGPHSEQPLTPEPVKYAPAAQGWHTPTDCSPTARE